jgi:hypothetical protein
MYTIVFLCVYSSVHSSDLRKYFWDVPEFEGKKKTFPPERQAEVKM